MISANVAGGISIHDTLTRNNVVAGNNIGTDATGHLSLGIQPVGVMLANGAQFTSVGADPGAGVNTADQLNVISGNLQDGVEITGSASVGNTVWGNYIGTDVTGTSALPNGFGVAITGGASSNTVGAAASSHQSLGLGNVISGNSAAGVAITGASTSLNVVAGNLIGVGILGSDPVPNGVDGITIVGAGGGNAITGWNVISGNGSGTGSYEIEISGSSREVVAGNYIGLNASGLNAVPSDAAGISLDGGSSNNTIGGRALAGQQAVFSSAGLGNPYRIARAANGDLYIAELQNVIIKVDHLTGLGTVFSSGGLLTGAEAMVLDPAANALIVSNYDLNSNTGNLVKISLSDGTQTLFSSGQFLNNPLDMAIEPGGTYVVASSDYLTGMPRSSA